MPTPPDPYKTAAAEAQFNRVNTYSPSGSGVRYGYTDPRTGEFRAGTAPRGAQSAVTTIESPWEKSIREAWQPASVNLAGRIIDDNVTNMPGAPRVGDRGEVAQTIFDRTMSMMQPTIDRGNSRLLTNLQARGIPVGSDAFNEAYGDQVRQTQDTISRLAMDSDMAAGGEQSRQFGLDSAARQGAMSEIIAAMGGGYNPPSNVPSGNVAQSNLSGLIGQQYQAQMAQYTAQQQQQMAQQQMAAQQKASNMSALGGLAGGLLMKSDRRIKRDIRAVGKRGGLTVYEYRYIWDRKGKVRRGYMAQEVVRIFPHAVSRMGRWFALDYSQLPEVTP